MNTKRRQVLLLGFAATLVHCDMASGTGGRPIQFEMRLETARSSEETLGTFATTTGWNVKLDQAVIAIGPVYVYQNPPPLAKIDAENRRPWGHRIWDVFVPNAHAHAGDEHFFGGEVKGEFLGQIAFDVLNPSGVRIPEVPGTLGLARSASIWLAPPRTSIQGDANALHGHHAYVVGSAEKEGLVIPFEGGLDIENEGTKQRIDGVPLEIQLDDGAALTFELNPQVWFDAAHFDKLSEKNQQGRYVITPDSQVRTAWFLGARGFFAFSTRTNQ